MKALWLSGGKDSVACLFLHQDELADIHVLWANTGKYLPEHLAWIERLKALCPNWHEVRTDRDAQNERCGFPADVLPVRSTNFGAAATGSVPAVKLQAQVQCCFENISGPLWEKSKELQVTHIICGQRNGESYKAPRKHGDEIGGVIFLHPIEDWTGERVMAFVKSKITVPRFYELEHTSVDCYDCTAYLAHAEDRVFYMRRYHPEKHWHFIRRLKAVRDTIDSETSHMRRILEEAHA